MSHLGRLKIFLGYASGVGKSRIMFEEAARRLKRGQDVVVGAFQTTVDSEIQLIADTLELVPMRETSGVRSMDMEALLARKPQVCIVDGLASDNPAGSAHPKRWMDVEDLLSHNISVVSAINVQYIEERQDAIEAITGKRSSSTVPQEFVTSAEEIVIVDAPVEDDSAQGERRITLSRLRELALVLTADAVDQSLEKYLKSHDIHRAWGMQERILVCFTPRTDAKQLMETARAAVERFHGELLAAYVSQPKISTADREKLEQTLSLAHAAGARVKILEAGDPVAAIVDFARSERVTQIFVGHSVGSALWERWFGNATTRLVRMADDMDVQIFPH